ncbi:hypothetical protein IJ425_04030 [bacterium]|nr:hypothetical protein [bacterium]
MKPTFNKFKNKTIKGKKYKNDTTQKSIANNSSNASNPITQAEHSSQIISGYFLNEKSYKEMIVQRVNNFLCAVLGFLVLFCVVCYYFVSCKEVQLNQISRETLELNYENDELQNKVDTLQSYYNIDKAVSKTNILERAKHVVEVDAIALPDVNFNKKTGKKTLVVSY